MDKKINLLKKKTEDQIETAKIALANRCSALIQHLDNIRSQLTKEDKPYKNLIINNLGEIQSQGTIIDAECGGLASKIGTLRLIQDIK